jgi:hypothetical protein
LEPNEISFFPLQDFDFTQNGQRNLWKYLDKRAANLEMFGVDLERLGGPEAWQRGSRVFSGPSPFRIPWARELFKRKPYQTRSVDARARRLEEGLSRDGAARAPIGAPLALTSRRSFPFMPP